MIFFKYIFFLKCVFYTQTFICFETETHTYLLNLILNRDNIIWFHVYIQILTISTRCWKSNIWNLSTQCSNNNKDFFSKQHSYCTVNICTMHWFDGAVSLKIIFNTHIHVYVIIQIRNICK